MQTKYMKQFLISVIVPFYNPDLDLFKAAIYSILSQSYTNWEVIIVNDGSTYENKSFLHNFINNLNDKRFLIIDLKKNQGPSFARNTGIDSSKGEIITFLDADDLHLPWYYEEIVNHFLQNSSSLILETPPLHYLPNKRKIYLDRHRYNLSECPENFVFPAFRYYPLLSKEEEKRFKDLSRQCGSKLLLFSTPRLAIKREVFKTTKYDPDFIAIEDTEFCLSIINKPELLNRVLLNPNFGYLYRIYSLKNRHTRKTNLNFEHMFKMIKKYSNEDTLANDVIKLWQRRNEWKYCGNISKILQSGSKGNFINIAREFLIASRKNFKTFFLLIKIIFKYKVLHEWFGIDFRVFEIPSKINIDKTMDIKDKFESYLAKDMNEIQKRYAALVMKSIF